ncbi:MAG: hypothetical protein COS43_06650 [Gallionellales bacterium CG03_land_8_20_14_0_80_55_15]|nr:MAG: hypothetical protein COS43_06650 [Gallionellales bacterium CG03_land_8_20_14_0_80_55_15]
MGTRLLVPIFLVGYPRKCGKAGAILVIHKIKAMIYAFKTVNYKQFYFSGDFVNDKIKRIKSSYQSMH